jgi:hypothetical protein
MDVPVTTPFAVPVAIAADPAEDGLVARPVDVGAPAAAPAPAVPAAEPPAPPPADPPPPPPAANAAGLTPTALASNKGNITDLIFMIPTFISTIVMKTLGHAGSCSAAAVQPRNRLCKSAFSADDH